ncbi:4-(cytidine 5'-diphospho)-2-C-methyl-D-erythritol kinase [Bacteroidota bacterium]
MNAIEVISPAKINIGLNIISKRNDGYHNLETIFYPIHDLNDNLRFIKSDKLEFKSNCGELKHDSSNLILKAVQLLEKNSHKKFHLKININKKIPIGAGLGGGSSNAAFTLKAINKLFNLNYTQQQLRSLALELGSDIPFFITPKPSFAWSRGELIRPIKLKINYPILIVYPGINISTKEVFLNITPSTTKLNLEKLVSNSFWDIEKWKLDITNDFEQQMFQKYPILQKLKKHMYKSGALFAQMTGTGSAIYGIFKDLECIKNSYKSLNKEYFKFISSPII